MLVLVPVLRTSCGAVGVPWILLQQIHEQGLEIWGMLLLEELCEVTVRRKSVHAEKWLSADPSCGLKL